MGSVLETKGAMIFNILVKQEADLYVAHCLELDIVATGSTLRQVKDDMKGLISTQVDYAFAHNNLRNLYRPAPPKVWKEFFACKEQLEERHRVQSAFASQMPDAFVPPWFIARTCRPKGIDV
jgi:hypothetical protein